MTCDGIELDGLDSRLAAVAEELNARTAFGGVYLVGDTGFTIVAEYLHRTVIYKKVELDGFVAVFHRSVEHCLVEIDDVLVAAVATVEIEIFSGEVVANGGLLIIADTDTHADLLSVDILKLYNHLVAVVGRLQFLGRPHSLEGVALEGGLCAAQLLEFLDWLLHETDALGEGLQFHFARYGLDAVDGFHTVVAP